MALTLYRIHTKACIQKRQKGGDSRTASQIKNDRAYRRCSCPIQAEGALRKDGFVRRSTGETSWEKAEEMKRAAEDRGTWEAPEEKEEDGPVLLSEAIRRFNEDATQRGLQPPSMKKYRILFDQLTTFAAAHGVEYISGLEDFNFLSQFRTSWKDKSKISITKKLERFHSFGNFCTKAGLLTASVATKAGLRSAIHGLRPPIILDDEYEAVPYSQDQMVKIIGAIERMPTGCEDRDLQLKRLKAQIFVMRYGGLAIIDAAPLTADRVIDGRLILRRSKTRTPVAVKLPDFLVSLLAELPLYRGQYFFWNKQKESSKKETATGNLRRQLRKLLKLAGVVKPSDWALAHGFRDTFAVEFLSSGGSMEELQRLLGHKSIDITQKHYAHWDERRRKQLDQSIDTMHARESFGSPLSTH
jgi:integrase